MKYTQSFPAVRRRSWCVLARLCSSTFRRFHHDTTGRRASQRMRQVYSVVPGWVSRIASAPSQRSKYRRMSCSTSVHRARTAARSCARVSVMRCRAVRFMHRMNSHQLTRFSASAAANSSCSRPICTMRNASDGGCGCCTPANGRCVSWAATTTWSGGSALTNTNGAVVSSTGAAASSHVSQAAATGTAASLRVSRTSATGATASSSRVSRATATDATTSSHVARASATGDTAASSRVSQATATGTAASSAGSASKVISLGNATRLRRRVQPLPRRLGIKSGGGSANGSAMGEPAPFSVFETLQHVCSMMYHRCAVLWLRGGLHGVCAVELTITPPMRGNPRTVVGAGRTHREALEMAARMALSALAPVRAARRRACSL